MISELLEELVTCFNDYILWLTTRLNHFKMVKSVDAVENIFFLFCRISSTLSETHNKIIKI